jgi:hypothetical protein
MEGGWEAAAGEEHLQCVHPCSCKCYGHDSMQYHVECKNKRAAALRNWVLTVCRPCVPLGHSCGMGAVSHFTDEEMGTLGLIV